MDTAVTGKLLDTTVLVDLSRGNPDSADYVDSVRDAGIPTYVSVVSAMELIAGWRDRDEIRKPERLIDSFGLIHLTPRASSRAYGFMLSYSRSHGLSIPDALIAAVAVSQDLELATDNERHFSMIPDLVVERPY